MRSDDAIRDEAGTILRSMAATRELAILEVLLDIRRLLMDTRDREHVPPTKETP